MMDRPILRCHRCAMRIPLTLLPPTSRTFSTTHQRLRHPPAIPVFPPTTEPALDSLLADLRKMIFIPSRLNKSTRELIFRRRHDQQLENVPTKVDIVGEEIVLQPIDSRRYKMDSCQAALRKVLHYVKQDDQRSRLEVLPGLLEAMNVAKRPATKQQAHEILKMCFQYDRLDLALKIVMAGVRTGVSQTDISNTRIVAWGFHLKAAKERRRVKSSSSTQGSRFPAALLISYAKFMEDIRRRGKRVMIPGWVVWAAGLEISCLQAKDSIFRARPRSNSPSDEENQKHQDAVSVGQALTKPYLEGLMQAWTGQDRDRNDLLGSEAIGEAQKVEAARLWGLALHALSLAKPIASGGLTAKFLEQAHKECLGTIQSLVLSKQPLERADPALRELYQIFWPLSHADTDRLLEITMKESNRSENKPSQSSSENFHIEELEDTKTASAAL